MKVLFSCYIFTLYHLLHPFYCFFLFSILFYIFSFIGSFLTIPICISLSCLPIGSLCSTIHFFFFFNYPTNKLAEKAHGRRECIKHLRQIVFLFLSSSSRIFWLHHKLTLHLGQIEQPVHASFFPFFLPINVFVSFLMPFVCQAMFWVMELYK